MGRKRNNKLTLYLSDKEVELLDSRAAEAGSKNRNDYLRKTMINGGVTYIVDTKTLFRLLKDLAVEISTIGRNINQIAARVNATNHFYVKDMEFLQETVQNLSRIIRRGMKQIVKMDEIV